MVGFWVRVRVRVRLGLGLELQEKEKNGEGFALLAKVFGLGGGSERKEKTMKERRRTKEVKNRQEKTISYG